MCGGQLLNLFQMLQGDSLSYMDIFKLWRQRYFQASASWWDVWFEYEHNVAFGQQWLLWFLVQQLCTGWGELLFCMFAFVSTYSVHVIVSCKYASAYIQVTARQFTRQQLESYEHALTDWEYSSQDCWCPCSSLRTVGSVVLIEDTYTW